MRPAADHVLIDVRLTPKGGADRIEGKVTLSDGRAVIAARVRAAPEDGRANAALEKLFAAALGRPARDVRIVRGHQSRLKQLRIDGDPDALLAEAERLWP